MTNCGNNQFLVITSKPYQAGTNNPVTLYVPKVYDYNTYQQQNTCHCHCYQSPHQEVDQTAYNIALVGNATKGVFEGIAEVIRACGTLPKDDTKTSGTTPTTTNNTPATNNTPSTPLTSTPTTGKPDAGSKPDVMSAADFESDFSKQWKNIGDKYKGVDKQCNDYRFAMSNGETEKADKLKPDLEKVQSDIEKDISDIKKEIEGGNLDDGDKAIAEKALKTLEELKSKVDNALKTEPPKSAETDKTDKTEETEETDKADKVDNSQTGSVDIDALRDEAKRLNAIFKEKKAIQDANPENGIYASNALAAQYDAISAYNKWAEAVADPNNKANITQIRECKSSLSYIIADGHNVSPKVSDLVDTSRNLLLEISKL